MKVWIIKTHDEGEFCCEANKETLDEFLKNYREVNEKRLRAKGHKQIIPEIKEVEMPEEEYMAGHASVESARYFNGIGLKQKG